MLGTPKNALAGLVIAALLVLLAVGHAPSVAGHDGEVFAVNIRAFGYQPDEARIYQGDLVRWRNLDSEANHTVSRDVNGDGDYNDTGEWDSGPLAKDEVFSVVFNASEYPPGNYEYRDRLANTTEFTGVVVVQADDHAHGHDHPAIVRVYEDFFHPNNLTLTLTENVTLRWEVPHAADPNATANATHAVARDANDDGDYDDPGEWDSGNLSAGDSYNLTLTAADFPPGIYEYGDRLANGSEVKGVLIIEADHHDEGPEQNGDDQPPEDSPAAADNSEADSDRPVWLLVLAGIAGAGAVGLAAVTVMKRRPKD